MKATSRNDLSILVDLSDGDAVLFLLQQISVLIFYFTA